MTLGRGQISLNFGYRVYFNDLIPNFVTVFSKIKDSKHIEQNFHSVARVVPQGGTWGYWGESKTLAWGF